MGLLAKCALPSLALLASCYEPQLVDCTIRCSGESDCATGQVCGADHFCAAPDVADHCSSVTATTDAGVIVDGASGKPDARPDAPPPDAPTHGQLRVQIEGKGSVAVQGFGTCVDDCTYSVPLQMPMTARAIATDDEFHFEKWTAGPCVGQLANCAFTPTLVVGVTAKFKKD